MEGQQIRLDGDWILGENVNIYRGFGENLYYFTLPSGGVVVIADEEDSKADLYKDKVKISEPVKHLTPEEIGLLKQIEGIVRTICLNRKAEVMLEKL